MAMELRQNADNSLSIVNDADSQVDAVFGGPAIATVASPRYYQHRVIKLPLAAVDTAGGALSWQNTFGFDVIVDRAVVDVTTKSTGAGTLSLGQTATSATTSSANLLDTLDVGTATGTFDNITDKGTLGKSRQKVANGKWVTGSKASGALAGLVGFVYLYCIPV